MIGRTLKPSWEDEGFWVDFQGSEIMKIYVFEINEKCNVIIGECSMLVKYFIFTVSYIFYGFYFSKAK